MELWSLSRNCKIHSEWNFALRLFCQPSSPISGTLHWSYFPVESHFWKCRLFFRTYSLNTQGQRRWLEFWRCNICLPNCRTSPTSPVPLVSGKPSRSQIFCCTPVRRLPSRVSAECVCFRIAFWGYSLCDTHRTDEFRETHFSFSDFRLLRWFPNPDPRELSKVIYPLHRRSSRGSVQCCWWFRSDRRQSHRHRFCGHCRDQR